MSPAGTTVREALESATTALQAAGCDTPRLDAQVLLAHVLGVDRAALITNPRRELTSDEAGRFRGMAARRRQREPVAYITGTKGFRRLDLAVDHRVLVPRPETEHLVEAALELPEGARVVDVGTGSGAVALALKQERPDLRVIGTDASADALEVARHNGERLGLEVEWLQGDLLDPLTERVDAVVSNPPYIRDSDPLPPEVADHEPALALFAGPDGLALIRRLLPAAAAHGAGFVALEVGQGQAAPVFALARDAGYVHIDTVPDLAGIERVVVARW
jgi:release factor glutamine methyltransferase